MGSDVAALVEALSLPSSFKAHHAMCGELLKLVGRASNLMPEIEAARPRCSLGIQALCSLNRAIDKAKQIIEQCCDSSKLYLVLTADVIVTRIEKSRTLLEQSLIQIQNMVPVLLAVEISHLIDDIRSATFVLNSSEEEAGRLLRQLLHQDASESNSTENLELKAFQFATRKLHITTPKTILTERRSIRKLLDRAVESDPKKSKILRYLMYLFKKYGNSILVEEAENVSVENEESYSYQISRRNPAPKQFSGVESRVRGRKESQTDVLSDPTLIEEFKCPLSSRLMYDPVVIASGQTFERMWIQKWFDEGNNTCPKTKMELSNQSMTPNTKIKDLISRWCAQHGVTIADPTIQQEAIQSWDNSMVSVASFGSSVNLHLPVDLSSISIESFDTSYSSESALQKAAHGLPPMSARASDDFPEHQSYLNRRKKSFESLSTLPELQWEFQCKVVEDFKSNLERNGQALYSASPENFLQPLVKFLSNARHQGDEKAQRTGCQLLLSYFKKSRYGVINLPEDIFLIVASLVDSEVAENALAVAEYLSTKEPCRKNIAASGVLSTVRKILASEGGDLHSSALKILYNLSLDNDVRLAIVSLECTPDLVPFLKDTKLAKYSLLILQNLCDIDAVRIAIIETVGCIASVADILEIGNYEEQEYSLSILLMLCSQREEYCQLVLDEGFTVIPALFSICINGNNRTKGTASELLRLLRDIIEPPASSSRPIDEAIQSRNSGNQCKEAKPSSRSSGLFGKKLSLFSKHKR